MTGIVGLPQVDLHLRKVQQVHGPRQMAIGVVRPLFEQPIRDGRAAEAGSLCLLQFALRALEFTLVRQGQREIEIVLDVPREFGEKSFVKRDRLAYDLAASLGKLSMCSMFATLR